MRLCLQPQCNTSVKGQRIVCGFHWSRLPDAVRNHVRWLMTGGASDGARVYLSDFYRSQKGPIRSGDHDLY